MNFAHHWSQIVRRWPLVAALTVLGGLAGLVLSQILPTTFLAEANVAIVKIGNVINFDPRFKTVTELDADRIPVDQSSRRRSLVLVASSPVIAASVFEKVRGQITPGAPEALKDRVEARLNGDLIKIEISWRNAAQAVLIANTWAEEFVARANTIFADNSMSIGELDNLAESMKSELNRREEALLSFLRENRIREISNSIGRKTQQIDDAAVVQAKLDRLLDDARALKARLATNGNIVARGDELAVALLEASAFSTWSSLPVTLQVPLDQLAASSADPLRSIDSLIDGLTKRRLALDLGEVSKLRTDVNVLEAQLEQEQARKEELVRARDLARSSYATIATKAAEARAAAAIKGSVARIALPAVVSEKWWSPEPMWYSTTGALLGLVAGLAFVFAIRREA